MTYRWFMHPNSMDVCVRATVLDGNKDGELLVDPEWWNLGYTGNPWFIDNAVFPRKFNEWTDITEWVTVPRVNSGLPGPHQKRG